MNELDTLVESARQSFVQALTPADLENAKALFLGKAGRITELIKGMASLSVEDKTMAQASILVVDDAHLEMAAAEGDAVAVTQRRGAFAGQDHVAVDRHVPRMVVERFAGFREAAAQGVTPSKCQPPGLSEGYTALKSPATATDPAGTRTRVAGRTPGPRHAHQRMAGPAPGTR